MSTKDGKPAKEGGSQITMEVCSVACCPLHSRVQHDARAMQPVVLMRGCMHTCIVSTFDVQDLTDEAKEEAAKGGGGIPTGMYN